MNFFEDLIDELKDEHLLEVAVIEEGGEKTSAASPESAEPPADSDSESAGSPPVLELDSFEIPPAARLPADDLPPASDSGASELPLDFDWSDCPTRNDEEPENAAPVQEHPAVDEIAETERFLQQLETEELKRQVHAELSAHVVSVKPSAEHHVETDPNSETASEGVAAHASPHSAVTLTETEYYRKRAVEEVTSLEMVDSIFSNVEREQMKIMPKPYDDFGVKKVLHSFLQVSGDINSPDHARAEFRLMQETESWYSALEERDRRISVENLRYCCETTRPPLSAPALLALARFYRNSIFTEPIRNKFDLIVTRLFSKDLEFGEREFLFSREELCKHLTELYTDWESLPLGEDVDENDITSMVETFDKFIAEAGGADCFGDLIKNDFFNRFRAFKKNTHENFYAPAVTAAAIECNVYVGNRYLELLENEESALGVEALQARYGVLHDNLISNATSKTVQLADLLEQLQHRPKAPEFDVTSWDYVSAGKGKNKSAGRDAQGRFGWLFNINKFILAALIATIVVTACLYLWVENASSPPKASAGVVQLDLTGLDFSDFVTSARVNNEALFVISSPAFLSASKEKKEEVLMKMVSAGKKRGYKKVHVLDDQGATVAAASDSSVEVK